MAQLSAKDVEVISHLMEGEQMACKKAKLYSNTLTDVGLSKTFSSLAKAHGERFSRLLSILNGGQA